MSELVWFYVSEGEERGPISETDLHGLAESGELKPTEMIWRRGLAEWCAAGAVRPDWFADVSATPTDDAPLASVAPPAMAEIAAPAAVLPYQGGGTTIEVSRRTVGLLGETRPWVLLVSILGFILAGLIGLGTIVSLYQILSNPFRRGFRLESTIFLLIFGLVGVVYAFLALHLMRYASRIGKLTTLQSVATLESALEAQRSFWRLLGTVAIVGVICYLAMMGIMFFGRLW